MSDEVKEAIQQTPEQMAQTIEVLRKELQKAQGHHNIAVEDDEVLIVREEPTPMGIQLQKHLLKVEMYAIVDGRAVAVKLTTGESMLYPMSGIGWVIAGKSVRLCDMGK
jgi:hypothetical protein